MLGNLLCRFRVRNIASLRLLNKDKVSKESAANPLEYASRSAWSVLNTVFFEAFQKRILCDAINCRDVLLSYLFHFIVVVNKTQIDRLSLCHVNFLVELIEATNAAGSCCHFFGIGRETVL